jgi:hypothetical protein
VRLWACCGKLFTKSLESSQLLWNDFRLQRESGDTSVKKEKANITYSGKKKKHTFTKLVAVSPAGRFWFISGKKQLAFVLITCSGSVSDQNLSGFPELLVQAAHRCIHACQTV